MASASLALGTTSGCRAGVFTGRSSRRISKPLPASDTAAFL
jgi:hypothetical protein